MFLAGRRQQQDKEIRRNFVVITIGTNLLVVAAERKDPMNLSEKQLFYYTSITLSGASKPQKHTHEPQKTYHIPNLINMLSITPITHLSVLGW